MLFYNFARIIRSRGIERPFTYLVKKGYSRNYATRIINNRIERPSLKEIEKFCVLFICTPNELLDWIPDKDVTNIEEHPLISLKRSNKPYELTRLINSVPLNNLAEIEDFIKSKIKSK